MAWPPPPFPPWPCSRPTNPSHQAPHKSLLQFKQPPLLPSCHVLDTSESHDVMCLACFLPSHGRQSREMPRGAPASAAHFSVPPSPHPHAPSRIWQRTDRKAKKKKKKKKKKPWKTGTRQQSQAPCRALSNRRFLASSACQPPRRLAASICLCRIRQPMDMAKPQWHAPRSRWTRRGSVPAAECQPQGPGWNTAGG